MKMPGYYSSGEFAAKAHITKKTIRYYDEHNILKPSFVNENGARFYTDDDFARLQQILLLKYLGFSLDDIKEITVNNSDTTFMSESLHMQLKLVEDKIEQMKLVKNVLLDTAKKIDEGENVDWSDTFNLIDITGMEESLRTQYLNSSNISARTNLHSVYSHNKTGWFKWVFDIIEEKSKNISASEKFKILELGCGAGSLWTGNGFRNLDGFDITLSDVSEGMLRDAKRNIVDIESKTGKNISDKFRFELVNFNSIPFENESFDMVIANHVLFYSRDREELKKAFSEIKRVLKKGGVFMCSTYSKEHMKEVSQLVAEFDSRIVLSGDKLYEVFGKDNGKKLLSEHFDKVVWYEYEDYLNVTEPDPLISYVLSCHGNQNQYLVDRYKDFRAFVRKKTKDGFYITKDAGLFMAEKA